MGQITITIGPVTATKPFNDAQGATIINAYIAQKGGPVDGSNQEKLDWYLNHIALHTLAVYQSFDGAQAANLARQNAGQETWE